MSFYVFCNFLALEYISEIKLINLYEFFMKPKCHSQKSLLWPTSIQCHTVPLFLSLVLFSLYILSGWFQIFLPPTENHLSELQMASYSQLSIYIWMPYRYLKTHSEYLNIAIILTHFIPWNFALSCIPYLVEESATHPVA